MATLDLPLDALGSSRAALAIDALRSVIAHIKRARSPFVAVNELFGPFREQLTSSAEANEPLTIVALDRALKRHLPKISSDVLAELVEALMRDMNRCEYAALLLAIGEIVRRKDRAAQQRIATSYKKAMKLVDAGHRMFGRTVQDELIRTHFPRFEVTPLAHVLSNVSDDSLSPDGDQMLALFAPALRRATSEADAAMLIKRLSTYAKHQDEISSAKQERAFDSFLQGLTKTASPRGKRHLASLIARRTADAKRVELLERSASPRLKFSIRAAMSLVKDSPLDMYSPKLTKRLLKADVESLRTLFISCVAEKESSNWALELGGLILTRLLVDDAVWATVWLEKKGRVAKLNFEVRSVLSAAIGCSLMKFGLAELSAATIESLNEQHARLCNGEQYFRKGDAIFGHGSPRGEHGPVGYWQSYAAKQLRK